MDRSDIFRVSLETTLENYSAVLSELIGRKLEFGEFMDPAITPYTRSNCFGTIVPVRCNGRKIGGLNVDVLAPRQGTGSEETYKNFQIIVPETLKDTTDKESFIPVSRLGLEGEIFLSLFTLLNDGRVIPYTNSLMQLSVDNGREIVLDQILGTDFGSFCNQLNGKESIDDLSMQTMCLKEKYLGGGMRPNCVYNPTIGEFVQVFGRLPIKGSSNPLLEILKKAVDYSLDSKFLN